jgi:hypothetical protein
MNRADPIAARRRRIEDRFLIGSSPFEFDLELALLVIELDLELEVDLVGHVDLEMHAAAVEFDFVVPSESVGESVHASGGLFSTKPLLLGDLH